MKHGLIPPVGNLRFRTARMEEKLPMRRNYDKYFKKDPFEECCSVVLQQFNSLTFA